MYALIMAGGRGARFWPRSREKKPKHLLDIISAETILRETLERIKPIVSPDDIFIVTGQSHAGEVIKQAPEIPRENIIVEPAGKSTAPCIGLAAIHIRKRDPDGLMMVLPSDHFIADDGEFRRILAVACDAARRADSIITIGIVPTGPATGYGYLELGKKISSIDGEDVYHVRSVREKPDKNEAQILLEKGGFFWNSGIFIGKVSVFMNAIAHCLPDLHGQLKNMEAALGTKEEESVINQSYEAITPVSFDYGILEKSDNILLVRGDFGWSDVGSWDVLWDILPKDEQGNAVAGNVIFLGRNARNSLIHSPRKAVALVGVEDLIVVDTKDALLICKRGASQEVRHIVELLEQRKLKEYL